MRIVPERLSLVFFVPCLRGGGAERVAIEFLEHLDRSKFELHLVLCQKKGQLLDRIPSDVKVHVLGKQSFISILPLIYRFLEVCKKIRPKAVISFLWYADAIQLQAQRLGGDWVSICSLHSNPRRLKNERFGKIKVAWMNYLYSHADAVLSVTQAVIDEFKHEFPRARTVLTAVQRNPFPITKIKDLARVESAKWPVPPGGRIVAVGSLEEVKGFDLLLEALNALDVKQSWHLFVLGEGTQKQDLVRQAESFGIDRNITFLGFQSNPYSVIASSDILVLSSRFEAFPSVLIEALILETAIVSVDCPSGPAEILDRGRRGCLVKRDRAALAEGIKGLLNSKSKRAYVTKAGLVWSAKFDSSLAACDLESIILRTLEKRMAT